MIDYKKQIRLSILLALMIILTLLDSYFQIFTIFIPGFKLGIANFIILFVIYTSGLKDALVLSILKVIVVGILFSGLFSAAFMMSLTGGILSTLIMHSAFKLKLFTPVGVSICGSVTFQVGQILVLSLLLNTDKVFYMLYYLIPLAILSGIITGFICKKILDETNYIYRKEGT